MSSSTSSFKKWLLGVGAAVGLCSFAFLAASEVLLRKYVLQHDIFEWIAQRLKAETTPNAAFGDSHVAAGVPFSWDGFVNFGVGQTTIRRLNSRIIYYYSKVDPGMVIVQADPHLMAEYRLEPHGTYIPEFYFERPRVLDERHRRFMIGYWQRFLAEGDLRPRSESTRPEEIWRGLAGGNEGSKPGPEIPAPAPPAASPISAPGALEFPEPPAEPQVTSASLIVPADADPAALARTLLHRAAELPVWRAKAAEIDAAAKKEWEAFLKVQMDTHTPVPDFRTRDEARIYVETLDFLIRRGAKVCLLTYPVDPFYREEAAKRPTYAEAINWYKEVARAKNIPYVSMWDRFDDPALYQNLDHVNEKGARLMDPEVRQACFGIAPKPVAGS